MFVCFPLIRNVLYNLQMDFPMTALVAVENKLYWSEQTVTVPYYVLIHVSYTQLNYHFPSDHFAGKLTHLKYPKYQIYTKT
jgi:membrane-associated phospholipid phosphatase